MKNHKFDSDLKNGHNKLDYPLNGNSIRKKLWHHWPIWLFPITCFIALIWFLIRVLPKPSRATYPCQRVAAPLAFGFINWIIGFICSVAAFQRAKKFLYRRRYVIAGIAAALGVLAVWWPLNMTPSSASTEIFLLTDSPNIPIGQAQGINPGRVVWIHDTNATSWDGIVGNWWDDNNTNQVVVGDMLSKSIRWLTSESNDAAAWDMLFRYFNSINGLGDVGYHTGEKIVIKLNMNQDVGSSWHAGKAVPSPQVVYSLLHQLIKIVKVPGSAITLYDASRYIGDPIYDKVRSNPDPNFQAVRFVVDPRKEGNGRIGAVPDTNHPIYFGSPDVLDNGNTYLPVSVTEAKYLINMALFRGHSGYGVTICAKNHYGSVYFPSIDLWLPSPLHWYGNNVDRPMGSYNCLVDLMGHEYLGAKTLLYMIDGLYGSAHQGTAVERFESFKNDWSSSIFVSQDPVAIDSVALDFLLNEPVCQPYTNRGNPDNYMHEAALANDPPSGTFYDPEGDGQRLQSLGVHEHWNNPVDKQYSRNLGTGDGIELINSYPEKIFGIEIYQGCDYRDPNSDDDLTYTFYAGIGTGDAVQHLEVITPAGYTFTIPNDLNSQSGEIWTWHNADGSTGLWEYEGRFADQNNLLNYGDGTYTITVHYEDGNQAQTTVIFGVPDTGYTIPQPTQKPILTYPPHNNSVISPLIFAWQDCNDPNATSIWLGLEKQDSNETIDINFPIYVNNSDPCSLGVGDWQAALSFENCYNFENLDGVPVQVGKYSESHYTFEVSEPPQSWKFGNLDGQTNVKLILNDSHGTPVAFRLTGGGYGKVMGVEFEQVILYDTTEKSVLRITTKRRTETSVGDIIVNGPLKGILAKTTDLRGNITVDGWIGRILLDDIDAQHNITIGGSDQSKPIRFKFDEVTDLTIESQTPIKTLSVTEWTSGSLSAPWIKRLRTKGRKVKPKYGIVALAGDFSPDLNLTSANSKGYALYSAKVAGLLDGIWTYPMSSIIGKVKANIVSQDWEKNPQ